MKLWGIRWPGVKGAAMPIPVSPAQQWLVAVVFAASKALVVQLLSKEADLSGQLSTTGGVGWCTTAGTQRMSVCGYVFRGGPAPNPRGAAGNEPMLVDWLSIVSGKAGRWRSSTTLTSGAAGRIPWEVHVERRFTSCNGWLEPSIIDWCMFCKTLCTM